MYTSFNFNKLFTLSKGWNVCQWEKVLWKLVLVYGSVVKISEEKLDPFK